MKPYRVLLFDLDGTLTDPKPGITRSVQHALKRMGIVENDLDSLVPFIGPPLSDSFQYFYGMDDRQARQAVEFYREYFAVRGLFENAVFPGIVELLQELQMQGTRLMVATSKPTTFALRILDHFQLSPYFEYIAGSELDGSRVKKSEVIAHVLTERSLYDKTEIVMIGDREFDIVGAQKNGLDSIAVKYGYGTAQELESARPTYIVETVQELADLLAERELVS